MNERCRVLYVDDEPALCLAFARALEGAGCDVTSASAPEAALHMIRDRHFDILASDYRMPEMDGVELLSRARRVSPTTRRVLISGCCDLDVAVSAVNRASIDQLILKPWAGEDLRASIQRIAHAARLEGENRRLQELLQFEKEQLLRINRSLDDLVERRTSDLLDSLICALDLRDTETQWHSRRVAAYARHLGVALGLSGELLADVERGALLHDIGKIGVRDHILLKPGCLTEEEWAEMRRHPALGYEMLRGIEFLAGARLVVLQHQERWDGAGYPAALRGEEICIGARIFHIVDTYDAITSDRPYRRAQCYTTARAEIVRCSETQFDPRLVTVWCQIEEDTWHHIREQVRGGEPAVIGPRREREPTPRQ